MCVVVFVCVCGGGGGGGGKGFMGGVGVLLGGVFFKTKVLKKITKTIILFRTKKVIKIYKKFFF